MELEAVFLPRKRHGQITSWSVNVNDIVQKGQTIGLFKRRSTGTIKPILCPIDGCLKEFLVSVGTDVEPEDEIAFIEFCPHHTDFNGLCALCGTDLTIVKFAGRTTQKVFENSVNVTQRGMHHFQSEHSEALRRHRKILLVLDLDHTLLHATMHPEAKKVMNHPEIGHDMFLFQLHGKHSHFVKLRPHVHEFLTGLSSMFDMHVFTWGSRDYAQATLQYLDPQHQAIKQRIITRDDCLESAPKNGSTQPQQKCIERVFPVSKTMALILDDSPGVWIQSIRNLIEIQKFILFPTQVEFAHGKNTIQNCNTSNTSFDVNELVKRNQDNVLLSVRNILQAIHRVFFILLDKSQRTILLPHDASLIDPHAQYPRPDVCVIFHAIRHRVLSDCVIAIHGFAPQDRSLHSSAVGRMCCSLGASLSKDIDSSVTHLIAKELDSAASIEASQIESIFIVRHNWLLHCAAHYYRAEEKHFLVSNTSDYTNPMYTNTIVDVQTHVVNALHTLKRCSKMSSHRTSVTNQTSGGNKRARYEKNNANPTLNEDDERDDVCAVQMADELEAFMSEE